VGPEEAGVVPARRGRSEADSPRRARPHPSRSRRLGLAPPTSFRDRDSSAFGPWRWPRPRGSQLPLPPDWAHRHRREGVSTSPPRASARPREHVDVRALLRDPWGCRLDRPELCKRAWDGRGSVRLVVPEPVPDHRRELSCEGGDRGFTATATSTSGIGLRSLASSAMESGASRPFFFRRKPPAARATRVRRLLTTQRCSNILPSRSTDSAPQARVPG
jgi:hypothetical protein